MSLITLTTDFGTRDGYVGEVKGVLATRAPDATLLDIAHDVEPGDIRCGAWILGRIWVRYPAGTVHLAVIDPGVGGERMPIVARLSDRWYVGPDNGLLTHAIRSHPVAEARRIEAATGEGAPSDTFHGRDLFAPAAAHLSGGGDPRAIGPEIDRSSCVVLPVPRAARRGDSFLGHVVHVDRFGNLITNLPVGWLPAEVEIRIAGITLHGPARSYDAVPRGELLVSRGSGGTLEIAVRDGRADRRLGVTLDAEVEAAPRA